MEHNKIIYIHGIGNKSKDKVSYKSILNIRDQMINKYDAIPMKDGKVRFKDAEYSFDTVYWGDKYKHKGGISQFLWILKIIPISIFLFWSDSRDTTLLKMSKLLKYDKKFEYNDPFKRFINTRNISRVIIPIMLLNACISIINNIPYSFYVIIPAFIVVVLLGGGIYLFKPKYNLLNHVRMAAQKDEEYEKVIMYIQESLNKLSNECDNIFIVAHSQGGYLMYQILSRNLLKKKSNIMFISLGSGLKAISLISKMENYSVDLSSMLKIYPNINSIPLPILAWRCFIFSIIFIFLCVYFISTNLAHEFIESQYIHFFDDLIAGYYLQYFLNPPTILGNFNIFDLYFILWILLLLKLGNIYLYLANYNYSDHQDLQNLEFPTGLSGEWYDIYSPRDPVARFGYPQMFNEGNLDNFPRIEIPVKYSLFKNHSYLSAESVSLQLLVSIIFKNKITQNEFNNSINNINSLIQGSGYAYMSYITRLSSLSSLVLALYFINLYSFYTHVIFLSVYICIAFTLSNRSKKYTEYDYDGLISYYVSKNYGLETFGRTIVCLSLVYLSPKILDINSPIKIYTLVFIILIIVLYILGDILCVKVSHKVVVISLPILLFVLLPLIAVFNIYNESELPCVILLIIIPASVWLFQIFLNLKIYFKYKDL